MWGVIWGPWGCGLRVLEFGLKTWGTGCGLMAMGEWPGDQVGDFGILEGRDPCTLRDTLLQG